MKSIIQAMLEEIYIKADKIAKENGAQIVKAGQFERQYFISLQQLESILKDLED